ncbi:hypothetical protein DICSQDRAFT_134580 [Dichomitus squalens LYAD-421 SS1]|uniref:uncharacterized protein n=1 Tax=Dichomitus squalens (strain LYAD-421) TaxID=732165 RepID=UPI0004413421|nr:uncharacterized protein DICSQDRAFT_134580 [Dichomitus squalens LYAD-421 SS1]EJF63172.1 hypothetical protein DICSQDRAFT_134580 [Dichomitus squalens LYAD-421 SS1]
MRGLRRSPSAHRAFALVGSRPVWPASCMLPCDLLGRMQQLVTVIRMKFASLEIYLERLDGDPLQFSCWVKVWLYA